MCSSTSNLSSTIFAQNWTFNIKRIFRDFGDVSNRQPRIHRIFCRSPEIKGVNMCFDTCRCTHRTNFCVTKHHTSVQISRAFLLAKRAKRIYFTVSRRVIVGILCIVCRHENIAIHIGDNRRNRYITFSNCYFRFLLAQLNKFNGTFWTDIWFHMGIISGRKLQFINRVNGIELFRTKKVYDCIRRLNDLSWQGRQDLNLRHPVLETGALPTELLPYMRVIIAYLLLNVTCRRYKGQVSQLTPIHI
jgi:hypothetical protein